MSSNIVTSLKTFLPLGVILSIISIIGEKFSAVPYSSPDFVFEFAPYLLLMACCSVVYWFAFLKNTVSIRDSTRKPEYKLTGFLLSLVVISIILLITTSKESLDLNALLKIIGITVLVGINEEFAFRLVGYKNFLSKGLGIKKSILLSSILFSLFHLTNLAGGVGLSILFQLMNTFMMGVVIAFLYYQTGRILVPIAFHALWDTLFLATKNVFSTSPYMPWVTFVLLIISFGSFGYVVFKIQKLQEKI